MNTAIISFYATVKKELYVYTRYLPNFAGTMINWLFRVIYFLFMAGVVSYSGNVNLEGRNMVLFFCSSFLIFSFFNTTLRAPFNTVNSDLYNGTLEYIYLTPTSQLNYYFGCGFANALLGTVFFVPIYIFLIIYSRCSFYSAVMVLAVTLVGIITTISMGIFMALLGIIWRQAGSVFDILFLLFEFLAGAYIPIQEYAPAVRGMAYLLPYTWSYELTRHYLIGSAWAPVYPPAVQWIIYIGMAVLYTAAAFYMLGRISHMVGKHGLHTL